MEKLDQRNNSISIVSNTGTGKTIGVPIIASIWAANSWDSYHTTLIATPLRSNVTNIYSFSVKNNLEQANLFGFRCNGQESNKYKYAPIKFQTTQVTVNQLLFTYKNNQLNGRL